MNGGRYRERGYATQVEMRATIHQKNSIAIHLNRNNCNIHTFNTQNQEINIYAQIFRYLNIPIFRYSNIYENLQGAWEPVNVDAAARTSAQEIEVENCADDDSEDGDDGDDGDDDDDDGD